MMKFMRHGFFSFIFLAMLVLAGFSLVLTDWTGSFRSGVSSHDVAKIEGEKIGQMEFSQMVARTLRAQNIRPEQAYRMGLIDQILTSEIWQRMLSRAALQYGIAVDDTSLLAHLQRLAEPVAKEQKTTPAEVIKRFIAAQDLSEAAFLSTLRRELTNNLVRDVVGSGALPSPLLTRALYAHAHQTRNVDYVVFMDDDVAGIAPPAPEVLEKYYQSRQRDFMQPERRTFRLATLTRATLEKSVAVTDDEISAFYNEHKDKMIRPEMRNVTLTTFPTEAAAEKNDRATRTDTNDFANDASLPDYLKPIASLKPGGATDPIETPLGWIIAKLNSVTPGGAETLDQAKKKIADQLRADKLGALLDEQLEKLDQAHEDRAPFDDLVKAHGMTVQTYTDLTREGTTKADTDAFKDLGAIKASVLTSAFAMAETGWVSPPLELANGNIGIVIVDTIVPSTPKPLETVRETLVKDWMVAERKKANVMALQSLLPDLVAGKISVADVARQKEHPLDGLRGATRDQPDMPAAFDRAAWVRLFDAEVGKPLFQTLPRGVMVAVVTSAKLADPKDAKPDALETLKTDTARALHDEQIAQFLAALNHRYNARVNDRLLREMYAPKAEE